MLAHAFGGGGGYNGPAVESVGEEDFMEGYDEDEEANARGEYTRPETVPGMGGPSPTASEPISMDPGPQYQSWSTIQQQSRQMFLPVGTDPMRQLVEAQMEIDEHIQDSAGSGADDGRPTFGMRVRMGEWRDAMWQIAKKLRDELGGMASTGEIAKQIEHLERVGGKIEDHIEGDLDFPRGDGPIIEEVEESYDEETERLRRDESLGPPAGDQQERDAFQFVRPSARDDLTTAAAGDDGDLQVVREQARQRATEAYNHLHVEGQQHAESMLSYRKGQGLYLGDMSECFLCSWRDRVHDGVDQSHLQVLHNIFWNEVARASSFSLACTLAAYFRERIYDPRQNFPILTVEMALAHIEGNHVLEPTLYLITQIRAEAIIHDRMRETLFRADDTFSPQHFNAYVRHGEYLLKLRSADPTKMAFSNSSRQLDHTSMAQPFNINAHITTRKKKALTIKPRFDL